MTEDREEVKPENPVLRVKSPKVAQPAQSRGLELKERARKALLAGGEAPAVPSVSKKTDAATVAARVAERNLERQRNAHVAQEQRAEGEVFYLRCPCAKAAPGVFFTCRPDLSRDCMPPSDKWFASYRSTQDPWPANRDPICQVCLEESGTAEPLRVRARLVDSMSREEYNALREGLEDEQ